MTSSHGPSVLDKFPSLSPQLGLDRVDESFMIELLDTTESKFDMKAVLMLCNDASNQYNMLSTTDDGQLTLQNCAQSAACFCDKIVNSNSLFLDAQCVNGSEYANDVLFAHHSSAKYVAGVPVEFYDDSRVGALCMISTDADVKLAEEDFDELVKQAARLRCKMHAPPGGMVPVHRQNAVS